MEKTALTGVRPGLKRNPPLAGYAIGRTGGFSSVGGGFVSSTANRTEPTPFPQQLWVGFPACLWDTERESIVGTWFVSVVSEGRRHYVVLGII